MGSEHVGADCGEPKLDLIAVYTFILTAVHVLDKQLPE